MQQQNLESMTPRDRLKSAGLRVTPQRLCVYKALAGRRDHPTVAEVMATVNRAMPTVSVDTVYRTLETLCEAGLCAALDGLGEARRFDPNTIPHHHCQCLVCSRVFDVHYPAFDRLPLPLDLRKGWSVEHKSVRFAGTCPVCRKKKTSA